MNDLTIDELRERVLSDDLELQMGLLLAPFPPFQHLAPAASLKVSADALSLGMPSGLETSKHTEHRELAAAVKDAVEASNIAFEAALLAAWQMYWAWNHCKCPRCSLRRTVHNAEFQ